MDLPTWIALIVGVSAIISSVLGPIFTAWINRSGASKRQASELFFHEKTAAYYGFLEAASWFLGHPDDATRIKLLYTTFRAMLFSADNTSMVLAVLIDLLNHADTPEQVRLLPYSEAFNDAVLAMRKELEVFQKPLKRTMKRR